jgi:hypothetical protein
VDGATDDALWLSQDTSLDEWTRTFFRGDSERRKVPEIFGEKSGYYWVAAAPALALPAPTIGVLEDGTTANSRKINIQVRSLRHAPRLSLSLEGTDVISSKVEGRLFSQAVSREWRLEGFGLPEAGINIELNVQAGSAFKIRLIDFSYELPQTGFQPRPSDTIPQPSGLSDTTVVAKIIVFQ